MRAKSGGADVRMIYSTQDALKIARDNPNRQVMFFAIGFETTTPPRLWRSNRRQPRLKSFNVLCNHVLTPAAMHAILSAEGGVALDGFVGSAQFPSLLAANRMKCSPTIMANRW
mgnify:CR=1 FL=1